MLGKHWEIGRLHLYVGLCETLALKIEADFIDGWGLHFQVLNAYFSVEWWSRVWR